MKIQLSEHFTYKKLFRFTLPSICMMIFMSIYGMVDGFFVSNFVDERAFVSVNFIMPVLMLIGAIAFMLGTGGSALVAKTLGEGDKEKANSLFSLFVYTAIVIGVVLGIISILCIRPIAALLGASREMMGYCLPYARIVLAVLPFTMLQYAFHSFFATAEKPGFGFIVTVVAGCTNMLLDALFIIVFHWGVKGAAAATAISQFVGGLIPLVYFAVSKKNSIRLGKAKIDIPALVKASGNGMSEFLSNVAMSVVGMLYNAQLLRYAGENGIAAYGVLMYVGFLFFSVFIGYCTGTAPIVSYHYGAKNEEELKSLLHKSLRIIIVSSVAMVVLSQALAYPLSLVFVGYNPTLVALTRRAFFFYSFLFAFAGVSILGSSFFTALNNGLVSAAIAFLRVAFFQIVAVLVFPLIWGTDGIWLSVVFSDFAAMVTAIVCFIANRKKYNYW